MHYLRVHPQRTPFDGACGDPAGAASNPRMTRNLPARPPTDGEHHMATDYDAPRKTDEDVEQDSIQELQARRSDKSSGVVDEDETEAAEGFELPGADLSGEELAVRVLPRQADEFTCSSCFLVHHRSQLAYEKAGQMICTECAA
jgi:hypothetical protein